jgi:uncharacterized protein YbaP (TraB family)
MEWHSSAGLRATRPYLLRLGWLFATILCLIGALSPVARSQSAGQGLPLWEIAAAGGHVYMLGSVHMLRESDHPLPAAIYDAYAAADALIMELDITAIDPIATQMLVNELGMIQNGKQLCDLLGSTDCAEAQRLAERVNIPLSMLTGAEPWFAAITIDALLLMRLGFSPAHGIETSLAASAAEDGKPVSGFETERQQLEMLDALSPEAQRDLLIETLLEGEDIAATMDDLVRSWRHGDTERLEAGLLREIRQYPEIYQAIVVRRNENWVEQIIKLLDDRKNYLIIVGAMHMIGDNGVPALLRQRGYEVRQLRSAE